MKENKQPTQGKILLGIAMAAADFIHTYDKRVYASIELNGHRELWEVRSEDFSRWLRQAFFLRENKAPSSQALNSTLRTLEGFGEFKCPQRQIFTRIAGRRDRAVYVDLVNDRWESVRISRGNWKIGHYNSIHFQRAPGMLSLPYPSKDGDISALKSLLNVDDKSFILIVAWLIQAFNPSGPYPVLVLNGGQGTAKSSAAKILRSLIDPNGAQLRTDPRNKRDLFISARNSWVLNFDNLSGMKPWLSDALCQLSTDGGFSTRKLGTDESEIIFTAKRPIILNGITDIVTQHDLADRAIFINLEPIPDNERLPEKELKERLNKALLVIFGGLLDAVSEALRNIPTTTLDETPRMADFALWVNAAEPALPWAEGEFMAVYTENRKNIVRDALESNPLAVTLMKYFEGLKDEEKKGEDIVVTGMAGELLDILERIVDFNLRTHKLWPRDAQRLGKHLRKISSFLRKEGIEIEYLKRTSKGQEIKITVKRVGRFE